MSDTYPKDDFDDISEGGPAGVHRKPTNPWAPVIPFLVVLLVAPLLAWGVATLIQRNVPQEELIEGVTQSDSVGAQSTAPTPSTKEQSGTTTVPKSDHPTAAPDDPSSETTPEAETPSQTVPAATVDYATSIEVLNGTGIDGHAGAAAETLASGGFTNTSAGNATDWSVDQSTVFYGKAESKATAEAIASSLGITNVVEDASAVGDSSVVVLLLN